MRAVLAKGCVWLAASFATAAVAHVVLGFTAASYAERAHAAIVPLALTGAALALGSCVLVMRRALGDRDGRVVFRIEREIVTIGRPLAIAAVSCGALGTLIAIETLEQFVSAGHVIGISDALGDNCANAIAIVFAAAVAVVASVRRCVRPVAACAAGSALRAASWIVATCRDRIAASDPVAWYLRSTRRARRKRSGHGVSRAPGLRAPPHAV